MSGSRAVGIISLDTQVTSVLWTLTKAASGFHRTCVALPTNSSL